MLRRRALLSKEDEVIQYVDLGLPSGLMWAIGNLCKDSQGSYYIGEETEWGTYASWGNIDGHNEGEGYNFNSTTYNGTAGKNVNADIPSNDADHDICLARLGAPWHLPTKEDFKELDDNTDSEWVADYNGTGVAGRKFMNKSDHSAYIFLPASGRYNGTTLGVRGTQGDIRSASYYSSSYAYQLVFSISSVTPQNRNNNRYYGLTVRPVKKLHLDIIIKLNQDGAPISGVTVTVTDSDNVAHTGTTDSSGQVILSSVASGKATVSATDYILKPSSITVSAKSRIFTYNTRYTPFGVWAYYADGTLKSEAEADSNAIGVAVITANCGFVIDKTVTYSGNRPAFGGIYKDLNGIGVVVTSSESDAKLDFDGEGNTPKIIAACAGYTSEGVTGAPAAEACRAAFNGEGYLGSLGEWTAARANKAAVDSMMSKIGGTVLPSSEQYVVWSSTLRDATTFAWHLEWSDIGGTYWYSNRSSTEYVRAFKAL